MQVHIDLILVKELPLLFWRFWVEHDVGFLLLQILIQGIASLFVVMYGIMYIAGDFKEIRAVVDLENKSWETLRNLPSFQIFNHRGKSLWQQGDAISDAYMWIEY